MCVFITRRISYKIVLTPPRDLEINDRNPIKVPFFRFEVRNPKKIQSFTQVDIEQETIVLMVRPCPTVPRHILLLPKTL